MPGDKDCAADGLARTLGLDIYHSTYVAQYGFFWYPLYVFMVSFKWQTSQSKQPLCHVCTAARTETRNIKHDAW